MYGLTHQHRLMYPSIYNGIKYFLSIISCCLIQFPIPFFIAQTVYSLYALYWDIHEDWGKKIKSSLIL